LLPSVEGDIGYWNLLENHLNFLELASHFVLDVVPETARQKGKLIIIQNKSNLYKVSFLWGACYTLPWQRVALLLQSQVEHKHQSI
jgi:hypothetical protein